MKARVLICSLVVSLVVAGKVSGANCTYSISPVSANHSFAAVGASFGMSCGTTCSWAAGSTNEWVHTSSSGTGNGTINYTVDANASYAARTGYIVAGGKTFTVTQTAAPMSLSEALGTAALTWETSPDYPWSTAMAPQPTFDGVASATSGNRFQDETASWLRTEVLGPGRLTFWWKVDSDVTTPENPYSFDYLEFQINGEAQSQIMGQVDWNFRSYAIPAGTNVLLWQYVKDFDYATGEDRAWLDRVTYTTNATAPLQQALNTCGIEWSSGGNTNPTVWLADTAISKDGLLSARSGSITHFQETWMRATVSGATNVSFWWRVSSEANYDWLEFYTNNVLATRISGEVGWASNYFRLYGATNTLMWRYAKNGFDLTAKGLDAGWVDEVKVSPTPAPFPFVLGAPARANDSNIGFAVSGEAGCPCLIQFSTDLASWQTLTNFVTDSVETSLTDLGATNSVMKFYRSGKP